MKKCNERQSFPLLLGLMALLLMVGVLGMGSAQAADDWYLGVSVGPLWRDTVSDEAGTAEFETGFSAGAFLGYRIKSFRVEGEYSYFDNGLATLEPLPRWGIPKQDDAYGHVDADLLFLNAYYDFKLKSRFTPYIGGGLGGRNVSIHGLSSELLRTNGILDTADSEWTFAYQVKAGVGITLTPRAELIVGYRYVSGDDLVFYMPSGTRITPHAQWHNLETGVRINF
jgi:opacity protein-like surface antigen